MPEFGTSGLRGLAVELTDYLVAEYVAGFAGLFPHDGTVLIGRDLRASSPRIAAAVARGAAAAGLAPVDCGVLPTPALALAAEARGTVAVMVTGSHIPADRNGLKFYRRDGEITKADEAALSAAARAVVLPGGGAVKARQEDGAARAYLARYAEFFGGDALAGLRVGVWEHSSAAREVLPEILAALGADVVRLGRSEDFVAVDTEAVDADVRARLAGWVREHRLDAIVSTDGDADRPLLADDTGRIVPGDVLGPITARALGADEMVTPVSSNTLVDLMGAFRAVERCRIGSPYVIAAMERRMAAGARVFGYEPNGGALLGFTAERAGRRLAPLLTRDCALPLVAVLAAARGGSVSGLVAALPARRTATDRLKDVPTEKGRAIAAALIGGDLSVLPEGLGALTRVETTDGARMTFDSGLIVTVRPSGNAPELRAYVEAEDDARAGEVLAAVLDRLLRATV